MENKEFKEFFQTICLNEKNELTEVGQIIVVFMGVALLKTIIKPKRGLKENEEE